MKRELKDRYTMEELLEIVADLRAEDGCPWDRVQTFESTKKCLSDETQEVLEAVDKGDMENLCEELGDVLMQVLMYSRIAEEQGLFSFEDVVTGIARKLVRRHPHVFGDGHVSTPEEALAAWKAVKAREKAGLI